MNSDRKNPQRTRWLLALLGGVAVTAVFLSSWLKQMTADMKATVEACRERAAESELVPALCFQMRNRRVVVQFAICRVHEMHQVSGNSGVFHTPYK
jgi:hypothetical protein